MYFPSTTQWGLLLRQLSLINLVNVSSCSLPFSKSLMRSQGFLLGYDCHLVSYNQTNSQYTFSDSASLGAFKRSRKCWSVWNLATAWQERRAHLWWFQTTAVLSKMWSPRFFLTHMLPWMFGTSWCSMCFLLNTNYDWFYMIFCYYVDISLLSLMVHGIHTMQMCRRTLLMPFSQKQLTIQKVKFHPIGLTACRWKPFKKCMRSGSHIVLCGVKHPWRYVPS